MAEFGTLSLLILLSLVILLLLWVLRPLWQRQAPVRESAPLALALLAEREASLASLRDLDFEFQAGRIGRENHAHFRDELLARGARVLSALDRLSEDRAGENARLTAAIEAEVAALLEAEDHYGTICAGCGRPAAGGDRFCASCGRALIVEWADATDVAEAAVVAEAADLADTTDAGAVAGNADLTDATAVANTTAVADTTEVADATVVADNADRTDAADA